MQCNAMQTDHHNTTQHNTTQPTIHTTHHTKQTNKQVSRLLASPTHPLIANTTPHHTTLDHHLSTYLPANACANSVAPAASASLAGCTHSSTTFLSLAVRWAAVCARRCGWAGLHPYSCCSLVYFSTTPNPMRPAGFNSSLVLVLVLVLPAATADADSGRWCRAAPPIWRRRSENEGGVEAEAVGLRMEPLQTTAPPALYSSAATAPVHAHTSTQHHTAAHTSTQQHTAAQVSAGHANQSTHHTTPRHTSHHTTTPLQPQTKPQPDYTYIQQSACR